MVAAVASDRNEYVARMGKEATSSSWYSSRHTLYLHSRSKTYVRYDAISLILIDLDAAGCCCEGAT